MLAIEIDPGRIDEIARELSATEKQVRYSYNRALGRTAATIRRLTLAGLKTELGLRNATALRRRVKLLKPHAGSNSSAVRLWVGTNAMSYSAFKGKPRRVPGGLKIGEDFIAGGFLASANGSRAQVFKRRGRARLPIDAVKKDIHDRAVAFLEDNVYVDVAEIFFKNFAHEIRARTLLGVGKSQ